MAKCRVFKVKDIDCKVTVEIETRKNILGYMQDYIDNMEYDWFDGSDESFDILYKDGSNDRVDMFYDGHKIKKINIASIVYHNPETDVVYGSFEMNDCGCVTSSLETVIDDTNIVEVTGEEAEAEEEPVEVAVLDTVEEVEQITEINGKEVAKGMVDGLKVGDYYRFCNAIYVVKNIYRVDNPSLMYKVRLTGLPVYKPRGNYAMEMDCGYKLE